MFKMHTFKKKIKKNTGTYFGTVEVIHWYMDTGLGHIVLCYMSETDNICFNRHSYKYGLDPSTYNEHKINFLW